MRDSLGCFVLLHKLAVFAMTSLLLFSISAHAAQSNSERFDALTKEIRCVVCQNQSIADSNAPLAKDLRVKVQQMIDAKKSDFEIRSYLTDRYGEFILLRSRLSQKTALLWLFPFIALLFASVILYRFIRAC